MQIYIPTRNELDNRVREAIKFFWNTRLSQGRNNKQGGSRSAVTGGKQLDGGEYSEPSEGLSIYNFIKSLILHVINNES